MYYVYVLRSLKSGVFYKGMTDNLDRRLRQHDMGKCLTTKLLRPLELIHVELCCAREEARRMEKYLKSGYGREIIRELFDKNS